MADKPASLHGTHINVKFTNARDRVLSGRYVGCSFDRADLRGAVLLGTFVRCTFYDALMDDARMNGAFIDCVGLSLLKE